MTDDTRLGCIEARAKGLGGFCDFDHHDDDLGVSTRIALYNICGGWLAMNGPLTITAAEALLSLWEPGAVVEIRRNCLHPMRQDTCELSPFKCGFSIDRASQTEAMKVPGPNCPGPAPDGKEYVIVLRDKVKVDHEQK